ncbi:hypothetical protein PF004_g29427, partial [Phytophthora fragariae]
MSSEHVTGLLAAATATAAIASIALLQKKRAAAYDPKNRKGSGQRRPSSNGAALNGASNGHTHHLTIVQNGRALADPAEGYE